MSLIKKLREEKRTCEEFEVMLRNLTLEEIFFLRLELEDESFRNNLNGYKIYTILGDVIKEGLIKFALNIKTSKQGASKFLGVNIETLERAMIKYRIPVKTNKVKLQEKKQREAT